MGKYFGTDGVRGVANKDLDVVLAYKIGLATADALVSDNKKAKIIIGKDTRISGDMFESAISAGICAAGCNVMLAGVVPTPAIAYLVKEYGFDAGVMISASHNPAFDNGIKIFNSQGFKLSDELEETIENKIDNHEDIELKTDEFIGIVERDDKLTEKYISHILNISNIKNAKNTKKVLIDCANGSASHTAGKIFAGADIINCAPDGLNINKNCGSTYLDNLSARVKSGGYDIGFAFDGDADRCLAIDEMGELICGDKIICILAKYLKKDAIAVTKLSNMGLHKFCKTHNITVEETDVGDRFVLERMFESGITLGGEQSGGIIALDYLSTCDGQITAVLMLEVLNRYNKKASEIFGEMRVYPQVALNVKAENGQKQEIMQDEQVIKSVKDTENMLNGKGRVLLRPSGTEPLIRIMIEGEDLEVITGYAKKIEKVILGKLERISSKS
jgi:phosphoglucosamine mutase